ncbi:MBOAT family O-acyltransferase [Truepera radiovictrix]|uniref:Membrane bound O-acyl transferase MBOAT family protein n=1 Tax=Truepera radiovictrix (strain DSM 17093 / CIP 108686 / LMG 22925 / RQ-24) TaxID=649638 RepID=D7CVM0_TRURR|nr:MBOAT family protein [Truepera radiovictrix]ADI15931.1 membrane bound O-acyl transferase MBOAT family protein [Truepera radiovictrix DSM 17093]WMT58442.1 MBOAT family protein [Truepera radiovictrix]
MVFSTHVFLFLFLPLFLALYYLLPFRFRSPLILVASYLFYAWWRLDFLLLLVGVTLFSFFAGRAVARARTPRRARAALALGVAGNLAALAYFKYFNFGVASFNALLVALGARPLTLWEVVLPIGLSFYIFQAISYIVDVYRQDAPPARSFWDLSAFIALFPQLIAGPVLRYKDLADQFAARTHTLEKFSEGALRFMVGFCKKVLVADAVAPLADRVFALPDPSAPEAWLGALAYTAQLYFDFSGYSDMAIGLGLMMGFRFRENFNHPYVSRSITEFWTRWHISLSSWLRDYLYIPLGGNRRGAGRTYVNLALVMLLGGLWHGAAWTFVVWGAWHGGFLALERFLGGKKLWAPLPALVAVPKTMLVVVLGWVTFRAADFGSAWALYRGLFGANGWVAGDAFWVQLSGLELVTLVLGFVLIYLAPYWRTLVWSPRGRALAALHLAILPVFVLGVMRLSAQAFSPFLYFQF